ncbi:hypothetical protein [Catenuloplanes japonicus]|uniref:hypothetical protein n=1 Tax=Catenuloplanes japonicus TaxID=33876 RepID=UPI0005272ED9|nr:hypothetical protein [Catenuloplanes japonicus]
MRSTFWLATLLLAGCAAPGAAVPGPTVVRVVSEIHDAADRLRDSSYRVVFDMTLSDPPARWQGTMRTRGGQDAIWSVDGTASDDGTVLDTVSIVDAGGVRYLNPEIKTFSGYEWAALDGPLRASYYWRHGRPVPLPEADPFVWCDLSDARMAVTAPTADGGLRYRLTGWSPGPVLEGALIRTGLRDPAYTTLNLTLDEDGVPARLDITLPGAVISLVVAGTGIREMIKVPEAGAFQPFAL